MARYLRSGKVPAACALVAVVGLLLAGVHNRPRAQDEGGGWRRIGADQVTDNPVKLFGQDWMLLAAGKEGDMNAMTIGWGGIGTLWGMGPEGGAVTVYVEPSRYTHEFMEKNEYFTVTAFPAEFKEALLHLGSNSGRNGDKIAAAGLTVAFSELGNPLFNEGRLVYECRKIYSAPFDPERMGEKGKNLYKRPNLNPHTIYIGEIVNVMVK